MLGSVERVVKDKEVIKSLHKHLNTTRSIRAYHEWSAADTCVVSINSNRNFCHYSAHSVAIDFARSQ